MKGTKGTLHDTESLRTVLILRDNHNTIETSLKENHSLLKSVTMMTNKIEKNPNTTYELNTNYTKSENV